MVLITHFISLQYDLSLYATLAVFMLYPPAKYYTWCWIIKYGEYSVLGMVLVNTPFNFVNNTYNYYDCFKT